MRWIQPWSGAARHLPRTLYSVDTIRFPTRQARFDACTSLPTAHQFQQSCPTTLMRWTMRATMHQGQVKTTTQFPMELGVPKAMRQKAKKDQHATHVAGRKPSARVNNRARIAARTTSSVSTTKRKAGLACALAPSNGSIVEWASIHHIEPGQCSTFAKSPNTS